MTLRKTWTGVLIASSLLGSAPLLASAPEKEGASAAHPSAAQLDRQANLRLLQALIDRRAVVEATPLPQAPQDRARQAAESRRQALAFIDHQIEILRSKLAR